MKDLFTKKCYDGIDVLKFLMALLVVVLHLHPFKGISPYWDYLTTQGLTRVAVPFFFLTAGFFLFRKMREDAVDWAAIRKYVRRIFYMLVAWSLVYLPFFIKTSVRYYHDDLGKGILRLIKGFFYNGVQYHLWFLPVLIYSVLFVAFLLSRRMRIGKILLLTLPLEVLLIVSASYYGLIAPLVEQPAVYAVLHPLGKVVGPSLGAGCFLVAFGAYLTFRRPQFLTHTRVLAVLTVVFGLLFYFEARALYLAGISYNGSFYFFGLLFLLVLVPWAMSWDLSRWHPITMRLRKYSMLLYFLHPAWRDVIGGGTSSSTLASAI